MAPVETAGEKHSFVIMLDDDARARSRVVESAPIITHHSSAYYYSRRDYCYLGTTNPNCNFQITSMNKTSWLVTGDDDESERTNGRSKIVSII